MSKSFDWENPWRPNIEAKMATAWGMAATATLIIGKYMPVPIPMKFSAVAALVCTGMTAYRGIAAYNRYVDSSRLANFGMEFMTITELAQKNEQAMKKKAVWLGGGFDWTDIEAQKMHSMIGMGVAKTIGKITDEHRLNGAYWLHGLDKETDRFMDVGNLVGHTGLIGTTRVGKTRAMENLIA
ncbi:MAG: conjugal transfer protein TraD, partial [Patescibacteria group bacterium]